MTKRLEVGKEYWIKGKLSSIDIDDDDTGMPYEFDFGDYLRYWFREDIEAVEVIPEREKVTIDRRMDVYITAAKENGLTLQQALSDFKPDNSEIFARAWLDGYEIEKEPLYTVEIPDPHCVSATTYLEKMGDGKVTINGAFYYDCVKDNDWKRRDSTQLTESEIKEDFEWAWQFAETVEE